MKTATAIENQVNRVSKKVYADLVSRVNDTIGSILDRLAFVPEIVKAIDEYIADGTLPVKEDAIVKLVFYMIKAEIDRAAARSRRARERAALRRERLQAEKLAALKSPDPQPSTDIKTSDLQPALAPKSPDTKCARPQTDAISYTPEINPQPSPGKDDTHGATFYADISD